MTSIIADATLFMAEPMPSDAPVERIRSAIADAERNAALVELMPAGWTPWEDDRQAFLLWGLYVAEIKAATPTMYEFWVADTVVWSPTNDSLATLRAKIEARVRAAIASCYAKDRADTGKVPV